MQLMSARFNETVEEFAANVAHTIWQWLQQQQLGQQQQQQQHIDESGETKQWAWDH
jgi:hypothetical protein